MTLVPGYYFRIKSNVFNGSSSESCVWWCARPALLTSSFPSTWALNWRWTWVFFPHLFKRVYLQTAGVFAKFLLAEDLNDFHYKEFWPDVGQISVPNVAWSHKPAQTAWRDGACLAHWWVILRFYTINTFHTISWHSAGGDGQQIRPP